MTKDFNHFTDRGFYTNEKDDPLANNLLNITGSKWRNLRAKLTPTFTTGKMRSMFSTLADCGLVLEKYMEQIESSEPVDIKHVLEGFTTNIIASCAFGLDCDILTRPDSHFTHFGQKIFTESAFKSFKNFFTLNYPNAARALRMRFFAKDINDFFLGLVGDTVRYREENGVTRRDMLQLLIDLKNGKEGKGTTLTMDEIAAHCFLFYVAGFETSATAMTFALFELAAYPELQERVRKEIREVLGRHGHQITYDSMSELKYLGQVINETLRKYPPIPFMMRRCTADYKLPGDGIIIEKRTMVLLPYLGVHLDEEHYPNPKVFDPERFNEINTQKRHEYAHLPFGQGPRICLGLRFGVMQTKVGLTSLLRKFKFTLNERTKLPLKFSTKSFVPQAESGLWLNFEQLK